MLRRICTAKIHNMTITKTDLNYSGSIGIDRDIMDYCGIKPWEMVQVYDVTNGQRFETYCIEEKRGSKELVVYGAASRLVQEGDRLIILTYSLLNDEEIDGFKPVIVKTDSENNIVK